MHLKYDSKISSLDALGLKSISAKNIYLHKYIKEVELDGAKFVMIPYQQDQSVIRDWVSSKISSNPNHLENSVGVVHMAINGAIQRYQIDNRNNIYCRTFDEMTGKKLLVEKKKASSKNDTDASKNDLDLPSQGSTVPKYLTKFKKVFSGHFHHHHFCDPKVIYAGSPMQHHFGDSGDSGRGVVIYDTESNQVEFVQNPNWDVFRTVRISSEDELGNLSVYNGKHVSVIYESMDLMPQSVQEKLLEAGAKSVRKHSVVVKKVKSSLTSHQESTVDDEKTFTGQSFEDFVVKYVKQYANLSSLGIDSSFTEDIINIGKEIIAGVSKEGKTHLGMGDTFKASLKSITIQNFLGVQGSITFDIKDMENGVWYLEGSNGSGKSTVLEAITWCLFERFLRSDMKADFCVNDVTKKDCLVRIDFTSGYSVERFRKYTKTGSKMLPDEIAELTPERKGAGIRVFKDGQYLSDFEKGSTKDSQTAIEGLLGVNYDTFSKSIVVGDNFVNFLTSDAKQRREMVEDLLGLYLFDDYLASAREKKKKLIETVFHLKGQEENLKLIIDQTTERIAKLQQDQKDSEEQIAKDLGELAQCKAIHSEISLQRKSLEEKWREIEKRKVMIENYKTQQEKQNSLNKSIELCEAKLTKLNQTMNGRTASEVEDRFNEQIDQVRTTISQLSETSMSTELELRLAKERVNKIADLSDLSECPYCEQKIDGHTHGKMDEEKKELEQNISTLSNTLRGLNGDYSKLEYEQRTLEENKRKAVREINQLQNDISLAEREKKSLTLELANVTTKLQQVNINDLENQVDSKALSEQIREKSTSENSYLKKVYEIEARVKYSRERVESMKRELTNQQTTLQDAKTKIESASNKTQIYEREYPALDFWEKAFDRKTRKSSSKTSKDEFETMRSFLLEKSIEDLNNILQEYSKLMGSDALQISFDSDLMIKEEYGKRSSGQRKRNHLMIHFALFELVRQRSRFISNFLMLDEVFDALDVTGQEQVQQVIELMSTKVDKVFVISHSTQNMELRKKAIRASMTNEGSKYEVIYR